MRKMAVALFVLLLVVSFAAVTASAAVGARGGVTPKDLPLRAPILTQTIDFGEAGAMTGTDKWAVVIGISDYYGSSSDLEYCDDDARDVQAALINTYGFSSGNVKMLLDNQATYANIIGGIDWLLANEGPDSTVVFYYSGHGSNASGDPDGDGETKDESIVPWELSRLYDGTLAQKFAQLESHYAWIAFDSCYAGGMNDAGITGPYKIDTMACSETGYSYESSSVENGFFTYLMVEEGMTRAKADSNGDGKVTVEEAYNYMKANMRSYSSQKPVISDQFSGELWLGL